MRATTSPTGDTVGFDGLRAVVGAGGGIVARFPGIVCVAQCPDPGPLRDFLALCASVGGPDPGRTLARQLATWMTGSGAPGSELRFGTVAAAGEQMAVFLVGAVEVRVDGGSGVGGLTLSGAHAAIGTDRLFARPRTPVVLSLDGGQVRADPAGVCDLQAGVVPGAGVLLHSATFDRDTPDSGSDAGLAGHEWFDTDGPSDASGQSLWSPDVPAQRTGERNGATHWPGTAEDGPWGGSASAEPEPAVEASSAQDAAQDDAGEDRAGEDRAGEDRAADDGGSFDDSFGGRHALLSSGDDGTADDSDRDGRDREPDRGERERDALDPELPYRDLTDPRDVEAPFESFFADLRNESRAPGLRTPDPRTGDPPRDAVAEPEADRMAGGPSEAWPADLGDAEPGTGFPADASGRDAARDLFRGPAAAEWPNADWPNAERLPADTVDDGDVRAGEVAAAGGPSTDQAPLAAPAAPTEKQPTEKQQTEKNPDDLFAAPPRARPRPDARTDARTQAVARLGRPPSPRPSARRPPADPEPDRTGFDPWGPDRAEPTPRPRDAQPPGGGRSAGGRGLSAAEATSTMPGTRFRSESEGDPDGAAALSESPFAERSLTGTSLSGSSLSGSSLTGSSFTGSSLSGSPTPVEQSGHDVRPDPDVDPARGGARIRGYQCENGHLNDPRSPTCRQCGATIDERAGGLVAGQRPPLGRLVFDDGEAHVVDGGYLVGRMPEVDDRVRTGELRPIILEDDVGAVSRVHAEIRVSGWDVIVVDTGSRNGTYVSGPDEGIWTALPPRRSRRLLPGARVRMGARMFVFESSSTVR